VRGKYRTEPKPDLNWVLGSVAMSSWIWQKQKQRLGNRNRNRNQVWFGFGLVCLCLALGEGREDNQTKTETEARSGYGFDFPVFVCASTHAKKTSQPNPKPNPDLSTVKCFQIVAARIFAMEDVDAMQVCGHIAQWLERLTADQQVRGSNPGVSSVGRAQGS
jgi:hypothetical protein